MSVEAGMPIVKDTGCKVGQHTFVWATAGVGLSLDPHQPCLCGLLTWVEAHRGEEE